MSFGDMGRKNALRQGESPPAGNQAAYVPRKRAVRRNAGKEKHEQQQSIRFETEIAIVLWKGADSKTNGPGSDVVSPYERHL